MRKYIDLRKVNKAIKIQHIAARDADRISNRDEALKVAGAYHLAYRFFKEAGCKEDSERCERQISDIVKKYSKELSIP